MLKKNPKLPISLTKLFQKGKEKYFNSWTSFLFFLMLYSTWECLRNRFYNRGLPNWVTLDAWRPHIYPWKQPFNFNHAGSKMWSTCLLNHALTVSPSTKVLSFLSPSVLISKMALIIISTSLGLHEDSFIHSRNTYWVPNTFLALFPTPTQVKQYLQLSLSL